MSEKRTADENSKPFEIRPGVGMRGFRGMFRRGDPAFIPPDQFHLLVNMRLGEGDVRSRPGMTQVEGEVEADACVTGIFEIDDVGVAILITQLGHDQVDDAGVALVPSPFQILAFNEERNPPDLNYWDEDAVGSKLAPKPWRVEANFDGRPFHTFRYYNGRLLVCNGFSVYEITFSEEESPRMDVSLLFSAEEEIPGYIASMCTRKERVDDPLTGDQSTKDVLYLGGSAGEVVRYAGDALETVWTLADASPAHVISYRGAGLVAAGDAGFSWQEQPTYGWHDETWGVTEFNCNGLCEFLGEVVFVGDTTDSTYGYGGRALHWDGTAGSPTVFVDDQPASVNDIKRRLRSPVVAGGALHFLWYGVENDDPPTDSDVDVARYTDFATGALDWYSSFSHTDDMDTDVGFFIEYAGAMLAFMPNDGAGQWDDAANVVQVFSGASPQATLIYNWPAEYGEMPFTGQGWEAIAI